MRPEQALPSRREPYSATGLPLSMQEPLRGLLFNQSFPLGRTESHGPDVGGRDTHLAKSIYERGTETQGTPLDHQQLREGTPGYFRSEGDLGQTGMITLDRNGAVMGSVRSPKWLPTKYTPRDKYIEVTFGGEQTGEHIEKTFLREIGMEAAQQVAKDLLHAAIESVQLPYHASTRGTEVESFIVAKRTGSIPSAPRKDQEELISGMVEAALDPADTIEEGMILRAQHVLNTHDEASPTFRLNTGVPITGDLSDGGLQINDGEYEKYVAVVSSHLKERMGDFDPEATQVTSYIARKKGYHTFKEMVDDEGHIAMWFNAAGHHSVSLPHLEGNDETNKFVVPTEIAIATADIMASDMGKVAELLMYSSPLLLEEAPLIQTREGKRWPLDYRDLYRNSMGTTFPGEFIGTPEELYERTKKGILDGEVHTIDRTAYRAKVVDQTTGEEKEFAAYHGPVRLRQAAAEKPIGRVEVTGPGSSFSLLDEAARDIFLDVLKLGAFEAIADGKHPMEYFKENYPSLTTNENRMDIGKAYNLNGPTDETATALIAETLNFLKDMADKYPPYAKNIAFAHNRIENLTKEATATSFEEYAKDPVGPVSQVMQNMYEAGYEPLEIAKATHDYELQTAKAFIKSDGDPAKVLGLAA